MKYSHFCWLPLLFGLASVAAQMPAPVLADAPARAMVRLAVHDAQTQFKIGDPVVLDLVFTSAATGYVVNTDTNPYLPAPDVIKVSPDGGWVRSHSGRRGQGINGNALVSVDDGPVRVPVLLNRVITFHAPGHYEVTLTTERLHAANALFDRTSVDDCKLCITTNAVGIDLSVRESAEESTLVASLVRELEEPRRTRLQDAATPEERADLLRQIKAMHAVVDSPSSTDQEKAASLRKVAELEEAEGKLLKQQERARREAAERLAYLPGDDAMRAKVQFIVADREAGDADLVGDIMVDGLPSSQNKQLQLSLLQKAWLDPGHVPTEILHTALRQARELTHREWATDDIWAGTPAERQAELLEYQDEINELITTLPMRTEAIRTATIDFLKSRGVPNQFNQRPAINAVPN